MSFPVGRCNRDHFRWVLLGSMLAALLLGCAQLPGPEPPPAELPPPATSSRAPLATPALAATASRPVPSATSIATRAAPSATPARPTAAPTATALPVRRVLEVPMHHQEHALSCEAAALKMALGVLGKEVTEGALLAQLARDPTPRKTLPDGSVQWGDPDAGFVGVWDGAFLKDGYGVYEGPIAELAQRQDFAGTVHTRGTDPQRLYVTVRQGFPSIVWIPYGLQVKGRGFWTTPAGKRVNYVVTEHAVVLAGVDAEGIYYADPMKPDLQRAPYSTFEAAFGELGRRAVVVRPGS